MITTLGALSPSVQWANSQLEPYRGLPFGPYLHSSRPRRPRALTAPLSEPSGALWQTLQNITASEPPQCTSQQTQCAFLTALPLDVRVIVYDMVLGGETYHISAASPKDRIRSFACQVPQRINEHVHGECHVPLRTGSRQLLSLLYTCRKIYSETVEILYKTNTFEFTQTFCAMRLLKIMLPPQRLGSIRRLRYYMRIPRHPTLNSRSKRDWDDLWQFFATELSGVQHLHIRLAMLQPMEAQIRETDDEVGAEWIRPMVEMAVGAHSRRRCMVHIVVMDMTLDLVRLVQSLSPVLPADVTELGVPMKTACALVHERIRSALRLER